MREIRSWLMDMDGVLVHEEQAIPGAPELIARLRTSGLDVPEESIWTSALATARFLEDQRPGGTAFVIGASSVKSAYCRNDSTFDLR